MVFLKQNWFKLGLISLILIGIIALGFYYLKTNNSAASRCPDEYKDIVERTASFEKWKGDFYDKNPYSNLTDYYMARKAFYEDNGCKKALERFDKYMVGDIYEEESSLYLVENIVPEARFKTNEELCREGNFVAPLEQEIAFNESIKKDEFVQHLRKMLDNPEAGIGLTTNFDNITKYADYIKSKFIVLSTDIAAGGGESIVLMFKDRPDKVFYAWVYDYKNNSGYDLRGFTEYSLAKNEAPDIDETQKLFSSQLCDKDFGI